MCWAGGCDGLREHVNSLLLHAISKAIEQCVVARACRDHPTCQQDFFFTFSLSHFSEKEAFGGVTRPSGPTRRMQTADGLHKQPRCSRACEACRLAHVACDVCVFADHPEHSSLLAPFLPSHAFRERPCRRCVGLKQECVVLPQKKRGRPGTPPPPLS